MLVLERVPKNRVTVQQRYYVRDPENYYVPFHVAFRIARESFGKYFQWQWKVSETIPPPWNKYNTGVTPSFGSRQLYRRSNQRGTIVTALATASECDDQSPLVDKH